MKVSKKIIFTALGLWISYVLAGVTWNFFGTGTPQGIVANGIFFGIMAGFSVFVVGKKFTPTGDS